MRIFLFLLLFGLNYSGAPRYVEEEQMQTPQSNEPIDTTPTVPPPAAAVITTPITIPVASSNPIKDLKYMKHLGDFACQFLSSFASWLTLLFMLYDSKNTLNTVLLSVTFAISIVLSGTAYCTPKLKDHAWALNFALFAMNSVVAWVYLSIPP
jgi:hypothetical protein